MADELVSLKSVGHAIVLNLASNHVVAVNLVVRIIDVFIRR